jgi:YD repeat-containing protein
MLKLIPFILCILFISNLGSTTNDYNSLNQLVKSNYSNGTIIFYAYDKNGNIISRTIKPPPSTGVLNNQILIPNQTSNNTQPSQTLSSRQQIALQSISAGKVSETSSSNHANIALQGALTGTKNKTTTTTPLSSPIQIPKISSYFGSGVLREYWTGISNSVPLSSAISDKTPSGIDLLDNLETPQNWSSNYSSRIRGYIHPPVTGYYTFWICGGDEGEHWLSSSSDTARKVLIASFSHPTQPGQWSVYSSQHSSPMNLITDSCYYFEVRQKAGSSSGDFVSVAWTMPDGQQNVITSDFISPYIGNYQELVAINVSKNITDTTVEFSISGKELYNYFFLSVCVNAGLSISINSTTVYANGATGFSILPFGDKFFGLTKSGVYKTILLDNDLLKSGQNSIAIKNATRLVLRAYVR